MPRRDFTKVPFAATGDTNVIPTPTQPDGSISLQTGWTFDYQRDNGAGGGTPDPLAKSIDREDMNGILNEITASVGEMQQNGFPIWVATAAPYPINANVRQPSDDKNYRSTAANNNTVPGAVGADWVDVDAPLVLPDATTTAKGVARFGTSPEQLAGALTTVMSNPAGVLALLTSWFPKRTFSTNDFIRIPAVPGGLLIQFGLVTTLAGADTPVVFPTPFTTALRGVFGQVGSNTNNILYNFTVESETLSGFSCNAMTVGGRNAVPAYWLAIGF